LLLQIGGALQSFCLLLAAHHNPMIIVESLSSMSRVFSTSHSSSFVLLPLVAIVGSSGSSGGGSGGFIAIDAAVTVSDFVIDVGTILNALTSLPPLSSLSSSSCPLAANWRIWTKPRHRGITHGMQMVRLPLNWLCGGLTALLRQHYVHDVVLPEISWY
jgi:hypothetical protein